MYNKNEKPLIKASVFYYDNDYNSYFYPNSILHILKKHNLDIPQKYYAGPMTQNRYANYNENFEDIFVESYIQKDVFEFDMSSGDIRKETNYWNFNWSYTFYKNSKLKKEKISFQPWNIISFSATHDWMKTSDNRENFINCFLEIIEVIKPIYGIIDDVDNKVGLLQKAGFSCVRLDTIQQIYWGNYWGKQYCEAINLDEEKMKQFPIANSETVGEGVFFSLTDNPLDYDTMESKRKRKEIKKYFDF